MGWCGATAIMDQALAAAQAAVESVIKEIQKDPGKGRQTAEWDVQTVVDDALRPFVSTISDALRDGDWDCIEEADGFWRFPQEMLGYDDARWEEWLIDRLADFEDDRAERQRCLNLLNNLYTRQGGLEEDDNEEDTPDGAG